ncbi:C-terminal helicase domain-containing protein [Helicobacter pylori]|nr:C-terminal helicase domain-containing protein [Helicobacter pylori]
MNRALNQRKIRKTIGIITPYNAQKNACDQKWKNATSRILMNSR